MKRIFFITSILIIFQSCNNKVHLQKRLEGGWVIEKLENKCLNKTELGSILLNSIVFNIDGTCEVPDHYTTSKFKYREGIGTWKYFKDKEDTIIIIKSKCQCNYFDGIYNLSLSRDSSLGNISVLIMENNIFYIKAYKQHFSKDAEWW